MPFLYPAFLIGALAIAIPIALHLLRRDVAPEVPFTAVRLLKRSPVERSRRRRLRDILLLVARVAALLLLAAAFARPYAPAAAGGGLRVVALDRSYSMSAPGRFDQALDLARAAIDGSHRSERVALLGFEEHAAVLAPPGSAADARAALAGLEAGPGATRYAPVVEKALELARGGTVRLVIVTDVQRVGWEGEHPISVPSNCTVDLRSVDEIVENLAVAGVRLEPPGAVVSIWNGGSSARESVVRASVDGKELASAPVAVAPGATVDVPVAFQRRERGAMTITVDDAEGLEADNSRHVLLGRPPQAEVLIVTAGAGTRSGFYLARALETGADEEGGFRIEPVAGAAVSKLAADRLDSYAAVVLLSTRGLDRHAREAIGAYVRHGGGMFAAAAPDLEPAVLSSLFDWNPPLAPVDRQDVLTLAATDLRHPILRPFGALAVNLGQVRVVRGWRMEPEGWSVAARFTDGTPALLERREGAGRVVLFASDLDRRWNDFPLHPAFVPFAIESVRYASREAEWTGEYTPARAPAGVGPRPGIYQIGADPRTVVVNVDLRESALSRMRREAFEEMLPRSAAGLVRTAGLQAESTEARQSYWRYGLMLMLMVLVAESFVGRKP